MHTIPFAVPTKFGTLKVQVQYEGLDAQTMRARAELEQLPGALSRAINFMPGMNVESFLKPQELEFSRESLREIALQMLAAADAPVTLEG